MSSSDWQEIIGTIGFFALISLVIWQLAATWRARSQLAREKEYRTIADRSVLVQEGTERQLTEISGRLTEMQARLKSLERVLKEVE
jgi:hypothetical protein